MKCYYRTDNDNEWHKGRISSVDGVARIRIRNAITPSLYVELAHYEVHFVSDICVITGFVREPAEQWKTFRLVGVEVSFSWRKPVVRQ